jgi:small subunit ribosomal protein S20
LANHKSAIKRHKQSEVRREKNASSKSALKTLVKKVKMAIESKNQEGAQDALKKAIPVIDKAASKHVIHRNAAARKISRLVRQVNNLRVS